MSGLSRREQIRTGLDTLRARVEKACAVAGRDPATVHVIVVTKTHPATDVLLLAELGVREVGENRDQEASAKRSQVLAMIESAPASGPQAVAAAAAAAMRWHFIGRLQSNKARHVAGYADVVHSVDRASLLAPLSRGAHEAGRELDCLVQVSVDGDRTRGGALLSEVDALADRIAGTEALRLRGLMAVAPLEMDPVAAFAVLPDLAARLRAAHPGADMISAGMSADLEAAIAAGATHLRVGTAILGERAPLG
jgi:pyridoxal phosphate enzyme (YggS family)